MILEMYNAIKAMLKAIDNNRDSEEFRADIDFWEAHAGLQAVIGEGDDA